MTAPAPSLAPDTTRCPGCGAALGPAPAACAVCGLALTGAPARRLWEVDSELLRLDASRGVLLHERAALLSQLRPSGAGTGPSAPTARTEWTPQRVQNLLLTLGGLLLAVAALVFAAVTYDRLGAGGRAAVLVVLTLAAGSTAPLLRRRDLSATAETLGAVTLVLAALDAYGLRTLGLAAGSDGLSYAAGSAAVLAAAAGAYALVVPLRVVRCAAVALGQLPVLLLLARDEPSAATAALVLAVLTAVDLAVLTALRRRPAVPVDVRVSLVACAAAVGGLGTLVALVSAGQDRPGAAAVALLAHAAVLSGAALLVGDRALRALLSGGPVVLVAVAAATVGDGPLSGVQQPLVPAAVGLLAVQVAARLPRSWRLGPVCGSLLVTAASLAVVLEDAVGGLLLPLTWLADPWSLAGTGAREAVGPLTSWGGSVVTTAVVAAAALAAGSAGLALHRERLLAGPAALLAATAVVLLPLGLDLTHVAALAVLLAVAAALGTAGVLLLPRRTLEGTLLAAGGTVLLLHASIWSLADREASLVVLPLAAVLLGALSAARRLPATPAATAVGAAGLLATAAVGAAGAAQDLAVDRVGGLLLLAVVALAGLAAALRGDRARRTGAEVAAVVAGGAAGLLAARDPGWLSWVLAGTAVVVLATALLPDRRRLAVVGGLLLTASSWVRLDDAGITAPEPYALPLAVLALGFGHLRRRAEPETRSWAAYGPGLSVLLLPSLLASFDDTSPARPLLLGLGALAVLLTGARSRLQAPLALGAAVLAVDALQLVGPYAAALPRWTSLGAAGVLLVAVGATYEQRLRDVARLRQGYDALV